MNEATNILTLDDLCAAFPAGADRFAHVAGVVGLAERLEAAYGKFAGKLKLAAIYHDIGYADKWRKTGFHPVDGAIVARSHGLDEDIAQAILHHGGSWQEARLSHPDLVGYYGAECRMMETPVSRALTYCDLHTGPKGEYLPLDERLADIRRRHAENKPLLQVMDDYEARFRQIDAEWQAVLATSSFPHTGFDYAPR